jgi:Big-like domain-containing protein
MVILFGSADGTFNAGNAFLQTPGPVVIADATSDGLLDVVAYDSHAVHVLVNERNDVNHPPLVPDYSVTSGNPCVRLAADSSDPDQHALTVQWFDASGEMIRSSFGVSLDLDICVDRAGTYTYRRTADDGRGGTASGTVTFTYQVTMKEIVLYAAAGNVSMAGNWSRVADATAAGGVRAHDANLGAPKVFQPSDTPINSITIPFLADPNLTYKLWVRLKADGNSWANDSVWVQFSGAASAPYTVGTTTGLSVSLEECVNCGVSGWGWEDDGFGAVNRNGVLLRFDPGPQSIVIQTREDGVSIDQVVLSAEKYLTARPGAAKNDHTILSATSPR